MSKKEELKKQISDLETSLGSSLTPENFKPRLKAKKEALEAELEKLEKEPAKPKKVFKKTEERAKAATKAPKKPEKPASKKAEKEEEEEESITIQGITITKKGCPEGYEAFLEFRKQKKKSATKSDAKPESTKAKDSFENGISHVFYSIPKSKIEKDPKGVKKALEGFKNDMDRAFGKLDAVLSKTQVNELKRAFGIIDKIVKELSTTK